ncbi:MAG: hypothetical protein SNJ52_05655, partial [Verrucomicrobiia bacterium]
AGQKGHRVGKPNPRELASEQFKVIGKHKIAVAEVRDVFPGCRPDALVSIGFTTPLVFWEVKDLKSVVIGLNFLKNSALRLCHPISYDQ